MADNKVMPDKDIAALSVIDRRIISWKNEECVPLGITAAQVPIVMLVCCNDCISQNEVVSLLGLEKSVVAKSVGNLIAAGFLTRERNPRDKRVYDLSPTAKAREAFPELVLQGQECMRLLTMGFSEEERLALSSLLDKLCKNAITQLRH